MLKKKSAFDIFENNRFCDRGEKNRHLFSKNRQEFRQKSKFKFTRNLKFQEKNRRCFFIFFWKKNSSRCPFLSVALTLSMSKFWRCLAKNCWKNYRAYFSKSGHKTIKIASKKHVCRSNFFRNSKIIFRRNIFSKNTNFSLGTNFKSMAISLWTIFTCWKKLDNSLKNCFDNLTPKFQI